MIRNGSPSTGPLGRLAALAGVLLALAACSPDKVTRIAARPAAEQGKPRLASPAPAVGSLAAERLNAHIPFSTSPILPMRPFVLKAGAEDRARALTCLAQAVYYEAAREPTKGQEAVAQVVLNRLRHPAYPKSVCAVVYQGASLPTGCQFTFTCDGSLRWAPQSALWRRAMDVARRALAGYVDKDVGSATHYHAAYVAPYWAPTLVKLTRVGEHIFYRWDGGWGEPQAFTGRYAGHEAVLTPAVLRSESVAPDRTVTLALGGEVRTYKVADPTAPSGERTRLLGRIYPARRQPTKDEIREINASLAVLEAGLGAPDASRAAAQTSGQN